jgi:hypothetical protein
MWRFAGASVIGSSHTQLGTACQDACRFGAVNQADDAIFWAVVADGAGSSAHGGSAASHVCSAIAARVAAFLERTHCPPHEVAEATVRDWLKLARKELVSMASKAHRPPMLHAYACTVLGAALGAKGGFWFQIGDGAIVLRTSAGTYSLATWPDNVDYPDVTHFVIEVDYKDYIKFGHLPAELDALAILSDGLQLLALDYAARAPHNAFFESPLTSLAKCQPGHATHFETQLADFLSEGRVNARTNDDKTLVLACRPTLA